MILSASVVVVVDGWSGGKAVRFVHNAIAYGGEEDAHAKDLASNEFENSLSVIDPNKLMIEMA